MRFPTRRRACASATTRRKIGNARAHRGEFARNARRSSARRSRPASFFRCRADPTESSTERDRVSIARRSARPRRRRSPLGRRTRRASAAACAPRAALIRLAEERVHAVYPRCGAVRRRPAAGSLALQRIRELDRLRRRDVLIQLRSGTASSRRLRRALVPMIGVVEHVIGDHVARRLERSARCLQDRDRAQCRSACRCPHRPSVSACT